MKKISLLVALLFLTSAGVLAQKYELGKVTVDELKEKAHPIDSSAVAAILFEKGEVKIEYSQTQGYQSNTVVKIKIKIYKKEGYEFANYARQYYIFGSEKDKLNFSKAYTYNLVDGKIEKTKLKSDGEFDEKVNKYWNRKKIIMPNVKEGSIIEFEYSITSGLIGTIDKWEFQTAIPVNYSEYATYIPEYFIYNTDIKGTTSLKITEDKRPRTITITSKERSSGGSLSTVKTTFSEEKIDYTETKKTYIAQNLPALKEEAFVNNIKNYTTSISHELSTFRSPSGQIESFSTDWETVTKTIYKSEEFGSELNKSGYFESDLNTLLAGLTTQKEKIETIFNFVKTKVKWDGNYGYYCDGGVKEAYRDLTGNVAEINLMLTAMLRYAKIEANPVLISTRQNGIAIFPNRSAYNYVIAAVEIENDLILMDATNKNAYPNILPTRDLNWFGRIIRKDGTSALVDLMPKMISKDGVNILATIKSDGTIEGKVKEHYFDYNAYNFRSQYSDLANEAQMERMESKYKGIEIEEYSISNTTELDKPVVETYSFKHTNTVEIIGDKMYFSPLLFLALSENPFKQEKREYPIDFSYPFQDKFLINITIPDGYSVETLPKSISIPMSNNNGSLKYLVSNADKQIQLSVTMDINFAIISAEYYDELKAFFAEVVKKETEKIVLKKV